MPSIIYTIGSQHIPLSSIIQYAKNYGVQYVADTRMSTTTASADGYDTKTLEEAFAKTGIRCLSFSYAFGFYPSSALSSKGEPLYQKVSRLLTFQDGIKRIATGARQDMTILIVESSHHVYSSNRYRLIGKALSEQGLKVCHIFDDGTCYTQEYIDNLMQSKKASSLILKDKAAELGRNGEEIAALRLMRQGHTLLAHNWNLHRGCELDLVTRKDGVLHFVEVKTRSSDERGTPDMAIDRRKINNIYRALHEYMARNGYFDMPFQVDSISIIYHSEDDYTFEMKEDIREHV